MAENTTTAAFSDTTGENSSALTEKVIAIPDHYNANYFTPPAETARFWRLNSIAGLKAMQKNGNLAQDPEHLATIKANHAELAQLEAKEAAVQARYTRQVQARNSDVSEKLAAEQNDQGLPTDSSSETIENRIALNERVPEKPTPAVNNQSLDPATINKAKENRSQDIPEAIASRYLRIDDRYFMPDKTIAFEDLGNKLKLKTENHTVIRDALTIAETRGWQSITVSGSQNFKHQVWREASLNGLEVTGYKPSALEIAELNHAPILRDARNQDSDTAKSVTKKAQQPSDGILRGTLLDHGEAHYRHDPTQELSYFVKLAVDGKEVTRWGVDLPRAIAESPSRAQIGDPVVLSNLGKNDVLITVITKDSQGNDVEEKKNVQRNTWQLEKADYQGQLQEPIATLQTDQNIKPDTPKQVAEQTITPISKEHQPQDGSLRGILVAHGADHYRHDPNQGESYFVTMDVDGKEMTQWGADFKRAFAESTSQPEIGDAIVLSNTGQQNVEIKSTTQASDGKPTEDKKVVKKNTWRVEKAEHQDAIEKSAEALRVGQEIERRVIDQLQQLAAALAVSKLGEKIAQKAKENGVLKSQDEVDTMVYLIREGLASALEKGKHIKTPDIQEQGQRASVDTNSIVNDHKPPELSKEPHDWAMTR